MGVAERQKAIIEEFSQLTNWEDRYKLVIERGRKLSPLEDALKTEENKVKGCQSQVWLFARLNDKGGVELSADSDALIVKGLVALLVEVYSGGAPDEILKNPPHFLKDLGFDANLSPSRTNGLYSMIKQIMYYATAFQYLLSRK